MLPTTRPSLLVKLRDPRDHEAWLEFASVYEPVIYRLLRRNGLNDSDAHDVLQDLLLTISRNIERWESRNDRGSFRGWLRRVSRNLVVSWIRRKSRHVKTLSLSLDDLLEIQLADDCPATIEFDRELQRSRFRKASLRVQSEVSPSTWMAFYEVSILGKSILATSMKLGVSAGAIRVAKCRVIARLREIVSETEAGT